MSKLRLVIHSGRVLSIGEKFQEVKGFKDKDTGQTIIESRSLGHYLVLDDGSGMAYSLGNNAHGIQVGDAARLVIEVTTKEPL